MVGLELTLRINQKAIMHVYNQVIFSGLQDYFEKTGLSSALKVIKKNSVSSRLVQFFVKRYSRERFWNKEMKQDMAVSDNIGMKYHLQPQNFFIKISRKIRRSSAGISVAGARSN